MGRKKIKHYRRTADYLREKIRTGVYGPERRLPAERALARELGISRVTLRQALGLLEQERLLRRKQGSGTYVSPRADRRIPLMIDYTGSMRTHAPDLTRQVLTWKISPAPADVAAKMGLEPGAQLLYALRIDSLKDQPIAYDHAYIAIAFANHLTERELARIDFIETWTAAAAFRMKYCSQEIEAVQAREEEAGYLRLTPALPVLKSTEIYYADQDRAAGLFISRYHPEFIGISSRYYWQKE